MSIFVDIEKNMDEFHLKLKFYAEDSVLALLGESGCGKSMTLKCIAGIETPDKGRILVDDEIVFDSEKKINLGPQKRQVGYLFQNYALFQNMTVFENIYAGANREKDKQKRNELVQTTMERLGIEELSKRYPNQLSGGQQQRVALARILVSRPKVLLLDEPFSALDSQLRFQMEQEVREVIASFGKTVLLVSHDRDEAFRMSNDIAIIHDGKIEAYGDKKDVFHSPKTKQGAMMTGCKNISPVKYCGKNQVEATDWRISLEVSDCDESIAYVGIRAHDICIGAGENQQQCEVVGEIENPFSYILLLKTIAGEKTICIEIEKEMWKERRAKKIMISIPKNKILLLKK